MQTTQRQHSNSGNGKTKQYKKKLTHTPMINEPTAYKQAQLATRKYST